MDLEERIARLIDPDQWEYADKIRAELPDSAAYLVEDSKATARRIIDELGLSEQRYPLGILIFGYIDSQEDA